MRSFSKTATVFVTGVLSLLSTSSFADDLFDMLQRMADADQKQNYVGTFILRKSDDLSALRVTHGVDDDGVWESLEALNGEVRKVVRHNNRVVSVYPERELVTIRHTDKRQSLHHKLPENIDQLGLFYTIERLEDDRVANWPALVFDLVPNDQYRYGYRYWVDQDTGMLLRCDLVTENNSIVEQMMFTALEYLPQAPSQAFELEAFDRFQQKLLDEPEVDVQQEADKTWAVNRLPKGFMLTQSTMRYSRPKADQDNMSPDLLHMVYSDGLASVSVFIEKYRGDEAHLQGASSMGAVNAFGNVNGDYFVTVVGEVPLKTVQAMAESVVKID